MEVISGSRAMRALLAAAIAAGATVANAASYAYDFSGDTTNDVLAAGYRTNFLNFQVSVTGTYTFWGQAQNYDNELLLYAYPPDLQSVNVNLLQYEDADSGTSSYETFNANLTAGLKYSFANTSPFKQSFGPFTSQISGPGQITLLAAVPEPETYAMLLAGLGLMGGLARRRRAGAKAG